MIRVVQDHVSGSGPTPDIQQLAREVYFRSYHVMGHVIVVQDEADVIPF